MTEGWKCPVCGRGVAPTQKSCDHDGGSAGVVAQPYPVIWPWPQTFPYPTQYPWIIWSTTSPGTTTTQISSGYVQQYTSGMTTQMCNQALQASDLTDAYQQT